MGAAAVPIFIGLMAGATVYAGYEKKQAGKAEKYAYEAKARQEKLAATDRELARRRELLRSLSQAGAKFAGQGTSMSGSPTAILLNDFAMSAEDDVSAAASEAALQSSYKLAGRNAEKLGKIGFISSLLSAGATVAGGFAGGGGNPASVNASQATSATQGAVPRSGVVMG